MDDITSIIAGMRDRRSQLLRVADMAMNPEIRTAVMKVVRDIEFEIGRLEAKALWNVAELKVPPSLQA
jgi:hypothetical protein